MRQKARIDFDVDSPISNVETGEVARSAKEEELLTCAEYIEGLVIEGEVRIALVGHILTEWGINSKKNVSFVTKELERMGVYVTRDER